MTAYALETAEDIQREQETPRRFIKAVKNIEPGASFTADDLAEVAQHMPTPQSVGGLYHLPEFKKLAQSTGVAVKSTRTTGYVTVWERIKKERKA